jgi:RNA polymerase sigma-70 factor (ECF subfamily)
LREVCGLTTEAIARTFLVTPSTLAQRIVRARQKIRTAGIPYEVPDQAIFAERLQSVLQVIYLVFNEGYSSLSPATATEPDRPDATLPDLTSEAIRLTRLLLELHPNDEINGLLALMLLQESRRMTRACANGNLILLEDQDRSLWNADLIAEGVARVQQAWAAGNPGFYSLQAAIAALHAEAASAADTDWHEISGIYTLLHNRHPSPVVALNRAIAIAMHQGPQAGINLITPLIESDLSSYHYAYAARAKLQRESNNIDAARSDYSKALELSDRDAEKAFLQKQLDALQ